MHLAQVLFPNLRAKSYLLAFLENSKGRGIEVQSNVIQALRARLHTQYSLAIRIYFYF